MKKYGIFILIVALLIGVAIFIYFKNDTSFLGNINNTTNDYEVAKISSETNIETNTVDNNNNNNNVIEVPVFTEEEFTTFSTKVSGTSARKNNISICASFLNNATVNAGDTFSFWNTVGNTTSDKGYKKAKSFDEHGNNIQTYGGGVCQVSTTLYNAVLASSELEVVERHPHSKAVTYVPKDKDASVCYSASDFKFKNNTPNTVKIYATYESNTLTIRLVKLSNS